MNYAPDRPRLLDTPHVVWALLALPGVVMTFDYLRGATFYGEVVHATGELSAQLLIATLAITPLRLTFPNAAWTRWLEQRRRWFGVATFGYAALHAVVYAAQKASLAVIVGEALEVAMWTGWVALLVMLALAVTSNDASVRRLGRRWKWLHRAAYVAALLTFAHWILSAFDPVPGFIHAGVLAAIEAWRLVVSSRASRGTDRAP